MTKHVGERSVVKIRKCEAMPGTEIDYDLLELACKEAAELIRAAFDISDDQIPRLVKLVREASEQVHDVAVRTGVTVGELEKALQKKNATRPALKLGFAPERGHITKYRRSK